MRRNPRFLTTLRERGCALLTLLFMLAPVWVLSIAWRGPGFALLALALILLVIVGLAAASRWLRRRRSA